jgi:hypothetical protein
MKVIKAAYDAIRPRLKTGDVVFFGGYDGWLSRLIRWGTLSSYSHAAIVWRADGDRLLLMESTTLLGKAGVQRTYLSERAADYRGIVDIAPLSSDARRSFDADACAEFLASVEGRPYDTWGAGLSGLGQYLRIPGRERYNALFCSELVDAAHRAGGLRIGKDHTPTPEELSRRKIHEAFYRVKEA